jgi:cytochrome b subunit of formate dehydrogenase
MSDRILEEKGLVQRHTLVELMEHWAIAVSGIVLVLTGIFELPIAKRYYITDLPGMAWSGDFIFSLNLHYMASVIFIAASLFHIVYHSLLGEKGMLPQKGDLKASVQVIKSFFGKGEEPPFHKYLPEQRLAYIGMAFIIAGLIISGLIKTYKNLYAPDLSYPIVMLATWTHNVFFVLFVLAFIAHMAAIIIKPNRPMVRGIFTGRVRLDYARHRHPLWMEEIWDETPPVPAQQLDLTNDDHQTAALPETDEEENKEPVSATEEEENQESPS